MMMMVVMMMMMVVMIMLKMLDILWSAFCILGSVFGALETLINDHDQQMSAKVEKVFNVYCSVF